MNSQVAAVVTVALVAFTLFMLAFAIRRLRKETRLNLRTVVLGAVVPLVSTAAYVIFAGSSGGLLPLLVSVAIGGLIGIALAWLAVIKQTPMGVVVRQSGLTLIIWSVVYGVTSLVGLIPDPRLRGPTLLALAAAAGMAAGSQLGLFARSRRGSQTPVMATTTYAQPAIPVWGNAPPPAAPAVPARPAIPPAAPPISPLPPVPQAAIATPAHYTHAGQTYLLGYTSSLAGIWDRRTPDRPVAHFPRTVEGRAAAFSQFSNWEPAAAAVMPYPGLALEPIADWPVSFTYLGGRFALGRTVDGYGIWDRWDPGSPVASFGSDQQSASAAWQTFSSWEPTAVAL